MCIYRVLKIGMQLRPRVLPKAETLSSAVKNASCSRGWLRLVVQCIFATLTVVCFIMIMILTITPPPRHPQDKHPRCQQLQNCRISCKDVPYFGMHEEDVIEALTEMDDTCTESFIILNTPMFINSTMPSNFLSKVRYKLRGLNILGGNLMHIPSDVFMNQYIGNINKLELTDINIRTLKRRSFAGLSNLEEFTLRNCIIGNISKDILRHVSDTIETLTITASGFWDPVNFTNSPALPKLQIVDFSYNHFYDILNENSFIGIINVKTLYLNSCRITTLRLGTFDNMEKLEYLYLNNNYLKKLPDGLFSNFELTTPKPKVNLFYNMWHCDCSNNYLLQLTRMGVLLNDPYCEYPEIFKDVTFSKLESHCADNHLFTVNTVSVSPNQSDKSQEISELIFVSHACYLGTNTSQNSTLLMYSPVQSNQCISSEKISRAAMNLYASNEKIKPKINWVTFSLLLRTKNYTMVEIGASQTSNYGLVWYQSTCPNEVYCINSVPNTFRVYNLADFETNFILCPILLLSGTVDSENCISFHNQTNFNSQLTEISGKFEMILYICTSLICLTFGAVCVYSLICKYPNLIKGSKRILFVKHKTVEALVLPPKVPLRKDMMNEPSLNNVGGNIFMVSSDLTLPQFIRSKSTRSSKSAAPSYISALQPTEDQLADWRIRTHFSNELSITSLASDLSSRLGIDEDNDEDMPYFLNINNEIAYESLK